VVADDVIEPFAEPRLEASPSEPKLQQASSSSSKP
jgi:hypothetical protein